MVFQFFKGNASKAQLNLCLQQWLEEFQLFVLLDVLLAHLQVFALPALMVSHSKVAAVYNAIRHAELVL
jgi:hypothetical protein